MIKRATACALLAVAAAGASSADAAFYAGLQGGYEWTDSDVTIPAYPANFTLDNDGFIGGAFAGVNFAVSGPWVIGVEGDVNWTNADGEHYSDPPSTAELYVIEQRWNASLRGRVGYTFDKTMVFGSLGWVWAEAESYYLPGGAPRPTASVDGWSLGIGAEHEYEGGWFTRAEYRYTDTNKDTVVHGGPSSYDLDSNTLLFGAGYKFSK
jgi:outer membrane immunogenic protein